MLHRPGFIVGMALPANTQKSTFQGPLDFTQTKKSWGTVTKSILIDITNLIPRCHLRPDIRKITFTGFLLTNMVAEMVVYPNLPRDMKIDLAPYGDLNDCGFVALVDEPPKPVTATPCKNCGLMGHKRAIHNDCFKNPRKLAQSTQDSALHNPDFP
ncbi:hypothetical protein INT47_012501 [Mucor saturninus]|uniref:Uncharacterized protein n=1 Tax=Mucor saturninus TaxID=64648 RepID=A0A8H7QPX1_9FUNG|nr:hypothetical protein INT47_012501 [Mucor saturninus]